MKTLYKYSFLLFFLFAVENLFSQSTEVELIKTANAFFEKEEYAKAMPLYSQLLSLHPTDPEYNYKYGATAIYGESIKKNEGIKYLKFACGKTGVSPLAYFFLGKVYHLNYQFNDAIAAYQNFKLLADKLLIEKLEVDQQIAMCENGKKLLQNIKDITVIDKVQTTTKDFFRNYELDEVGGKILVCPEELLSAIDKKNSFRPLIFFPGKTTSIYFSSYGNNKSDGKDLYKSEILSDGKYSTPIKIEGPINTAFDEDFPFMHSDGKTLYFSSKGHSSMGGYDVFKTVINTETGIFGEPENMDFAINTPDDDIFYIADSLSKVAFFASARNSKQGDLDVYKVNVASIPLNISLIQGQFLSEVNPAEKLIKINLIDATNNKDLGDFSSGVNGDYVISFPKGGKYKFAVTLVQYGKTYNDIIDVPATNKVMAYKQEIKIVKEGAFEKMIVINHFDQPIEGDISAMAQTILKQRAELEINFDPTQPVESGKIESVFSDAGFSNSSSNSEILEKAAVLINDKKNLEIEMKKNSVASLNLAENKKNEALNITSEAEKLLKEIEQKPTDIDNDKKLVKASFLKYQADKTIKESDSAYKLSYLLDAKVGETHLDIQTDSVNLLDLNNALATNSYPLALAQFKKQKDKEQKENSIDNNKQNDYELVRNLAAKKQTETNKSIDQTKQLSEEEADLTNTLKVKEKQLQAAGKKEKPAIQLQINEYQHQLEEQKLAIKESYVKVEKLQLESNSLASQTEILKNLKNNKSNETIIPLVKEGEKKNLKSEIASTENRNNNLKINNATLESILSKNPEYVNEATNDNSKIAEYTNYFKTNPTPATTNISEPIKPKNEEKIEIEKTETSEVEKIEKEKDWVKTLDKDIANLEKEKNQATKADKEKIQNQIDDLSKLKARKQATLALLTNENSKENESDSIPVEISKQKDIAVEKTVEKDPLLVKDFAIDIVDPTYQSELVKLNENKKLSETETNKRVKLNENLIDKIDNQIAIDSQMVSNSKNEDEKNELLKKINIEKGVKQAKQAEIKSDNEQLNILKNADFVNKNNLITQKIDSNYVNNYLAIDLLPINDYSKTTKKAVADFSISQKIKKKVDKNVADLDLANTDTEKELLQNEIQTLQKIIAEKTRNANDLSIQAAQLLEDDKKKTITAKANPILNTDNIPDTAANTTQPNEEINSTEEVSEEEKFRMEHLPPDDFSVDLINESDFDLNLLFAKNNYQSNEANVGNDSSKEIVKELTAEKENLNKLIEQYKNSSAANDKENLRQEIYTKTVLLNEKQLELAQNIFLSNQSEITFLDGESSNLKKLNQNTNSIQLTKADNLVSEAGRLKAKGIEKLASIDGSISLAEQNKIFKEALEIQKLAMEKYTIANNIYKAEPQEQVQKIEVEEPINIIKDTVITDIAAAKNALINGEVAENLKPPADTIVTEIPEIKKFEESAIAKKTTAALENNNLNVSKNRTSELQLLDERLNNNGRIESLANPINGLVEAKYKNQPEVIGEIKENPKYFEYFNFKIANDSLQKISAIQNKLMDSFDRLATIKAEQAKNISSGTINTNDAQKESDQLYSDAFLNLEKKAITKINARKADSLFISNENKMENLRKNFNEIDIATIQSIEENKYVKKEPVAILKTVNSDLQPEMTPDIEAIQKEKVVPDLAKVETKKSTTLAEKTTLPEINVSKSESKLIPKILTNSVFKIDTISKNRSTTIVQNPTLPNGLVYMVQVGAFKNPIGANVFNDFSPVLTDKLSNGITRYIVGLFIEINAANDAKNQIRAMGYKDAFVVAYQDGKRIQLANPESVINATIAENTKPNAILKVDNKALDIKKDTASIAREIKIVPTPKVTEIQIDKNFEPDSKAAAYYNDDKAAKAKQVEVIKGLFYTVQVGVYSKPVSIDKLFNITPLNSELLSNGFIRYTSGQFISLALASTKKDNIVNAGITDAFITAYYNGKRISVSQAQEFLSTYGNTILVAEGSAVSLENKPATIEPIIPIKIEKQGEIAKEIMNDEPIDSTVIKPIVAETTDKNDGMPSGFGNSLDDGASNETATNERVEYKVLLGQFDQNIPSDVALSLLNIQYLGVNMEPKENGTIIYTSNTVYFYKSASDMLKSFQEGGMNDAKIIAFIDKIPATVEEARALSGQ